MNGPWRPVRRGIVAVLAAGALLVAAVLGLQRVLMFPRYATTPVPELGESIPGLEKLRLPIDGGEHVEAWLLPGDGVSAARPGPLVIFAHGNAELIEHWGKRLAPYRRLGISVLLPEYRGYGRSGGTPSQSAIVGDFERFYDRVAARPEVAADSVVFHGRSIGGGVVCALARRRRPAALVLQSTFTSAADLARQAYFVPRFLMLDRFDNLATVRALEAPVLVVHGSHDRLIPPAHGRALAKAAERGTYLAYDAGHNDCPPDWARFFDDVERFLRTRTHVLPSAPT